MTRKEIEKLFKPGNYIVIETESLLKVSDYGVFKIWCDGDYRLHSVSDLIPHSSGFGHQRAYSQDIIDDIMEDEHARIFTDKDSAIKYVYELKSKTLRGQNYEMVNRLMKSLKKQFFLN